MARKENPVLIECIRIREGGTIATIGDHEYHFFPRAPRGPHLAEVSIPEHVARFLEIAAYRKARVQIEDSESDGSEGDDGTEGNADPGDKDDGAGGGALAKALEGQAEGAQSEDNAKPRDVPLSELTDEQLREVFAKEMGRKPSGRALRETLIAQIEQARAPSKD